MTCFKSKNQQKAALPNSDDDSYVKHKRNVPKTARGKAAMQIEEDLLSEVDEIYVKKFARGGKRDTSRSVCEKRDTPLADLSPKSMLPVCQEAQESAEVHQLLDGPKLGKKPKRAKHRVQAPKSQRDQEVPTILVPTPVIWMEEGIGGGENCRCQFFSYSCAIERLPLDEPFLGYSSTPKPSTLTFILILVAGLLVGSCLIGCLYSALTQGTGSISSSDDRQLVDSLDLVKVHGLLESLNRLDT